MSFHKKNKLVLISSLVLFTTGIIFIGIQLSNTNYLLIFYRKYISIVFNSCLCLSLIGAGYTLLQFAGNKKVNAVLIAISLLLTAVCTLTLLEHILHFNAGVDGFFIPRGYLNPMIHPSTYGKMLPATAIVYLCLGLALIGFCTENKTVHIFSQYTLHVASVFCSILLIGFAYSGISFVDMQAHTLNYFWIGGWIIILSIAASFRHSSLGLTNLFSGTLVGNKMARRLFLMMTVSILVFGLVKVKYLSFTIWQYDTSISLFVFCILVAALLIIWHTANWLNKVDLERIKAEYELKVLNGELEKRVEERTAELSDLLEKYKESELKFRSLVEKSMVGVYIAQLHRSLTYVNQRFAELFGYEPQELIDMGDKVVDIIYNRENRNIILKQLEDRSAAKKDVTHFEIEGIKKDGTSFWVEIYSNVVTIKGELTSIGMLVDITERKKAEESLIRSEARFRGAFENASIGVALVSLKGEWLQVNRALCEMLGYNEAELLLLTFQLITHPDDIASDVEFLSQMLRGETEYYKIEKRYIHKDGSTIWINLNVSLIRETNKQPAYFLSIIENITEKVESQFKFQNLVENFIVGVYIHQHGEIVYVNPRLLEESGYGEAELIGRPFEEFIYKDDLDLVKGITDEREKGQIDTIRYEARFVKKGGEPIWFEIFGSRTVFEGAPALMGTMVNITDRKVAEEEIHRLSRLYRFVSSINESMLKAENADQVYADACRIAIEVGEFQMAWVGSYDEKNDRIIPVAWSGCEDGFLARIGVGAMKVAESAIPSARAIRERKHFYYNDIANDPDIPQDIKYEMIKRSYQSGVSFPIFVDGEIVAAMVLLMSERFFFNEQEIELLRSVTDNIMFALDKIKIQALQNQSEANLRSIFDTTEVNYMLLDTNYDIVAINQQSKYWQQHLTGVLFEKGVNVIEVLLPEKKEATRALFDKVITTNHSEDYETSYLKDGVYTHFLANVKPIHDGKKAIGVCITGINITQQKKLTQDLLSHVEAMEEQNKKLREIAWIQSHVVRAPLSRLMGLIDIFNTEENNEEEKRAILSYILVSANELDDVIKNISEKVYE